MDLLRIDGLTKVFNGTLRAVDNLSLSVKRGSIVGFLGPNGAGKTTTIRMLTGMMTPTAGCAYIGGIDVIKEQRLALALVGAAVETPEFYPFLTANETLMFLGRMRGMTPSEVNLRSLRVLELFGLKDKALVKVGTFSKGMKQRLALAQAVLHRPRILILDEPISGLDPRGIAEIRAILKTLRIKGYTVFMSSHQLTEVQETCDRVAIIDSGRLLLEKSIDEVSSMLIPDRVEVVLSETARQETLMKLPSIRGIEDVVMVTPLRLSIEFQGDAAAMDLLLRDLLDSGLKVSSFGPANSALESVYLNLIRKQGD